MAKLFDKDGAEVEAFTTEELVVKNKEVLDKYIEENPSKKDEFDKLTLDLKTATDKIVELEGEGGGGEGQDDAQKKRLKDAKVAAETALEEGMKGIRKEMTDFKEGFVSGHKTKVLQKLAGDDPELLKKIEFEYDQYSEGKSVPANEIEMQGRMAKAFTLATGTPPAPNFMDGMGNSGARGDGANGGSGEGGKEETPNSKVMRKAFDISDKDVEEFTPKSE